MVYDRNGRGDQAGREQDYGRDYGSGRDYTYSSARDYAAAGRLGRGGGSGGGGGRPGRDDDRDYVSDFVPYGERDYGHDAYSRRDRDYRSRDDDNDTRDWSGGYGRRMSRDGDYGGDRYGRSTYGQSRDSRWDRGQQGYGASAGQGRDDYRGAGQGRGGYGAYGRDHDDHRRHDHFDRHEHRGRHAGRGGYSGMPQGYDYEDRGFLARAGDELRSWFGDEEAERRREADMQLDERDYGERHAHHRDSDYGSWRRSQIAALDRDYDEYRRENRSKFENEFSSWRTNRQTQRGWLGQVTEHMEVVGLDGSHVGTVDKVRGDRILLTKNDADAEGHHHSIPSSWLSTVDTKVTLTKTAEEAKKHWRDEENSSALHGYGDRTSDQGRTQARTDGTQGTGGADGKDDGRTSLDRSFSGTY